MQHLQDSNLVAEIKRLKAEKDAIILAHFYQTADIQNIADVVGDSLELARAAKRANSKLILFAGVHFMAEGAKILNPGSKVIVPDLRAGCSLADSCPPHLFKEWIDKHRKTNPNAVVVTYINCSASVKALSDIIVTSTNAEKIIRSVDASREILFAPDRNLGAYLSKKTGRSMKLWPGACIVHETFSEQKLLQLMSDHADAEVIAHPECTENILRHADFIGSTSQLIRYAKESPKLKFIVATEEGIIHAMKRACTEKEYLPAPPTHACGCNECPFMKLNTLENIYLALRDEQPEILVGETDCRGALRALERMLELSV